MGTDKLFVIFLYWHHVCCGGDGVESVQYFFSTILFLQGLYNWYQRQLLDKRILWGHWPQNMNQRKECLVNHAEWGSKVKLQGRLKVSLSHTMWGCIRGLRRRKRFTFPTACYFWVETCLQWKLRQPSCQRAWHPWDRSALLLMWQPLEREGLLLGVSTPQSRVCAKVASSYVL